MKKTLTPALCAVLFAGAAAAQPVPFESFLLLVGKVPGESAQCPK